MTVPVVSSRPGSANKEVEALNELFPLEEVERYPVVEKREMEIPNEMEPYIQKIEKEINLTKPITDNYGQIIVTSPSAQPTQIILPLTRNKLLNGLKQTVKDSIRWLSEWCLRLIKILGDGAVFQKEENVAK